MLTINLDVPFMMYTSVLDQDWNSAQVNTVGTAGIQFNYIGFAQRREYIVFVYRYWSSWTGDQLYSDNTPYGECSLDGALGKSVFNWPKAFELHFCLSIL